MNLRLGLAFFVFLALLWGCQNSTTRQTFTFETMGTIASCDLQLPDGLTVADAQQLVQDLYSAVNDSLSTWSATSEISGLNRAPADSLLIVSPWLSQCLAAADELYRASEGAFDPTAEPLMRLWGFYRREGRLPSVASLDSARALMGDYRHSPDDCGIIKGRAETHFDLGGIAKGFAVDLATRGLKQAGVRDALIDLGGNLYCLGGAPGRENWRVGIRDPQNRDDLFATLQVTGASVATSGAYERFVVIDGRRYGHIMNPATGQPATGLLSATVVARTGLLADGLSTTLFVLGPRKALALLNTRYPNAQAVLVTEEKKNGRTKVLATAGLKGRVEILPEYQDRYYLIFSSSLHKTQDPQSISRGG